MMLLVTGSRSLRDEGEVLSALLRGLERHGAVPSALTHFVHGACPFGVDHIVAEWASRLDLHMIPKPVLPYDCIGPNGNKIGPLRRNFRMVRDVTRMAPAFQVAAVCVAVWDGRSRGTSHTIALATAFGIPVATEILWKKR